MRTLAKGGALSRNATFAVSSPSETSQPTEVVVAAVMAVQRFVQAEAARLEELDVNPLMVTPDGALAADALIRIRA